MDSKEYNWRKVVLIFGWVGLSVFAPLLIIIGYIIFPFYLVLCLTWMGLANLKIRIINDRLKRKLRSSERYRNWFEIEKELQVGRGTLIIEHYSPHGTTREWWTPDNVVAGSPIAIPRVLPCCDKVSEFAQQVWDKYLHPIQGVAILTTPPKYSSVYRSFNDEFVTISGWIWPMKVPTNRCYRMKYPHIKIISIITWLDSFQVFQNELEDMLNES